MTSPEQELTAFKNSLGELMEEAPELTQFAGFIESAEHTATLDAKTKELISLAIGVAVRCEP